MEQPITRPGSKTTTTKKKKRHLSRKQSAGIFVALMLLIPLVQFVIFWIIPNVGSITMAFQKKDKSYSLIQFETFWKDLTDASRGDHKLIIYSVVNSLIYFAINIFICTPIVLFFSYVLFRKVPASGVFKVIFYLPSILGLTVTATLFKFLFKVPNGEGALGGPMWEFLTKSGILSQDFVEKVYSAGGFFQYSETAFSMVIAYSIWTCVGLNMILFHGAMKRIPGEVFESADMDGVGFFKQFTRIVIPLIWPTIATLIIFSLSGIFISYGPIMVLTPNVSESTMIGWFITNKTTQKPSLMNYAAAVGLIFTAIGLPFILFIKKGLDKIGSNVEY